MSAEIELAADAPVTLFRTDDPGEVIARATDYLLARCRLDDTGCWIWLGRPNGKPPKNYGRARFQGHRLLAHRLSYETFVGSVPLGLTLDHLCREPLCVNPRHLEPVTVAENIRRGTQGDTQRAKTHCPRGHAYNDANTYRNPRGQRVCRTCNRETMRERRELQGLGDSDGLGSDPTLEPPSLAVPVRAPKRPNEPSEA